MAGFQLKNFTSIVASMVNHARTTQKLITDFNIGSVFRTIVEAVAVEIDQLYQQIFNGLMAAIPVATYNSFNFGFLPATNAFGLLAVTCASQGVAVVYPAGTVFSSPAASTTYVSLSDVTVAPSTTTANIPVSAAASGAQGNLAAGVVFTASPTPSGFISATNSTAFSNGTDAETDDQRARRFVSYIGTLSRGTVAALIYGASTAALFDANGNITEQVKFVSVVEVDLTGLPLDANIPPVDIYVHNGVGSTSGTLVTQAKKVLTGYIDVNGVRIPGWKAAGIPITVAAATEVLVPVTAVIKYNSAYSGFVEFTALEDAVVAAIKSYIVGLDIGQTFLFAEVIFLVMAVPGVTDVIFSTPTADITCTTAQKLMPGAFDTEFDVG